VASATNYKQVHFTGYRVNSGTDTPLFNIAYWGYTYYHTVPPDGSTWQVWAEQPTVPAGCYLVSTVRQYVYNSTAFLELGQLNTINKSCAGSPLSRRLGGARVKVG
jgi:hypothetical protein